MMKKSLALVSIIFTTQAQSAEVNVIGGTGYLKAGALIGNTNNIGLRATNSTDQGLLYGISATSASARTTSYEEQRAELSFGYRVAFSKAVYLDPIIGVGYMQYQKPGKPLAPGWYDGDALMGSVGFSIGYRSGRFGIGLSVQHIFSNIDVRSDLSQNCSAPCGGLNNIIYNHAYFEASDAAAERSLSNYALASGTLSLAF